MIIKYVCSNGKEFDLYGKNMRATSGTFHSIKWKSISKSLRFGEKVSGFGKEPAEYSLILMLRGSEIDRKITLNELIDCFECDTANNTAGRIYFGDYYIDCFVVSVDTMTAEIVYWAQCEITLYCPYPFWIKETKHSFEKRTGQGAGNKKYTGRYAYRYANGLINTAIINGHYADCDFELTFCGPVVNPVVNIGNHPYLVNISLAKGENLIIDSAAETVTKITKYGERINAFNNRSFENSVFERIHPGKQSVGWSGRFSFDLVIYEKRGEPKWQM